MPARFRSSAVLLALLLVIACDDDPSGPCAEAGCIDGVDLAIVDAAVEWSDDQKVDGRVGARLVQPGDELTMRYRVMNRGSEVSEPAVLFVGMYHNEGNLGVLATMPFGDWISIPALEPGESVQATVERSAPNTLWLLSEQGIAIFELFSEGGSRYYDANPENSHVAIEYVVELPVVAVDLSGSADPLVAGEARTFEATVRNDSDVAPLAAGTELDACVFVANDGGPASCAIIGTFTTLPAVAAGEEVTVSADITVAPADLTILEGQVILGVGVCAARACDRVNLAVVAPDE